MDDEPERITPSSEAAAKAQLESDVARLESTLNAERFCIAVAATVLFDAFMFRDYKIWSAPVALLVVELTGLFVLGPEPGQPNRKERIERPVTTQRTNPEIGVTPPVERLS